MGRLDGKVAIITGGASGQGASHARKFVEEGAKVVLTDIDVEAGEALAKELGKNAKFVKHDVSIYADWENVITQTEDSFGNINVLVNNAGMAIYATIEEMTEEQYRKVIDINQTSVFFGMKAVIGSMKKAKGGSIINVSSIGGLVGSPTVVAYNAAKFALRGMTKVAALEFSQYGVLVNTFHPGVINTPFIAKADTSDEFKEEMYKSIPLGRVAEPIETSYMIVFLASDESSYSTGSEFIADGGYTAQ